jgi:hypothetical protein
MGQQRKIGTKKTKEKKSDTIELTSEQMQLYILNALFYYNIEEQFQMYNDKKKQLENKIKKMQKEAQKSNKNK